jgi:uncharacterized integral membrane protein
MRASGSRTLRRLRAWLLLLPLAIVLVLFAVANRALVTISLDPFAGEGAAPSFNVPLFIVVFAALIVGVVIGALASLARHWRLWRAARRAEGEAARLRAEIEAHKRTHTPQFPSLPPG